MSHRSHKSIPLIPKDAKRTMIDDVSSSDWMSHYRSHKSIPKIPKDAKRTMIDGNSTSESDSEYFSDDNERETCHSLSDESSEPPIPIGHYRKEYRSQGREKKYHEDRRRQPLCGVPMRHRVQSTRNYQKPPLSMISSSTNESYTTNEDAYDPMAQYSSVNKHSSNRHTRPLGMIQEHELSPISPCVSSSPRPFVSPPPISWKLRTFRPQYTSSVIDAPSLATMTNRHQQILSPPRMNLDLHRYDEIPRMEEPRRDAFSDRSSDSSYFDYQSARSHRRFTSSSPKRAQEPIRTTKYNLPAPIASAYGVKGIVFLRMAYSRKRLFVDVDRAEYFSEAVVNRLGRGPPEYKRRNRSTYIQLEMVHKSRDESNRKRSSQKSDSSSHPPQRTKTVENCDEPKFNEKFTFKLSEKNHHDCITISVIERTKENEENKRRRFLGNFTFHISQIIEKADQAGFFGLNDDYQAMEVINDGYFTLESTKGRKNNFPMSKIVRSTNYSLEGPSSTSSSSLNAHSPQKMLRSSEWPPSSHLPSRSSSTIPPSNNSDHRSRIRPTSYVEGHKFREDIMPSLESFENSTGSSSIDYDFNRHRMTLPSITTTSSSITSDEGPSCSSSNFNPSFLHPGESDAKNGKSDESDRKPSRQEGGVRRAASFTFSPTGSHGKHNRRPEAVVGKEDEAAKKKLFGPLTKTFSYIRSKVDSAISTSSLYPTKDEVRQWENSFEALLNHKYGQMLFSQFLSKEFCAENIEFWCACEEFKKMKDGKKSTTKANEIYKKFVAEGSLREVNLDSDTRAATKAAMESGCRPDTFNLAQGKIEHLMETDKHKRFLKDKIYLDMLTHAEGKAPDASENGGVPK